MSTQSRNGLPIWVWIVFTILLTLCVPWYVGDAEAWTQTIVWAFPLWALVMVLAYLALAGFGCFVFLKMWPTGDDASSSDDGDDAP